MARQVLIASAFVGCTAETADAPDRIEASPVVTHPLPMVTHDAGVEAASACIEGWEECNGNEVRQCTRGEWSPWGACPYACIAGAAGSGCTGVCIPGSQRGNCNGTQTCDEQGLWQPPGGSCEALVDAQASD